eukprot:TRINITY_DN808_c0_g1_i5.p1 TRINITY_DN808_c0_g1~~TRINITY_DN808_c0_g1_i5.p1  ORF type:complete len:613 (-),score=136.49 TRINITY_DN808_c0_g1_i5:127-1752(-)
MNLQIFSMRAIDEYGKTFPSDTALAGFVIPGTNQPMVPPLDDNSSLAQQIKSKLSTFSWISHLLQSQKLLLQQEGQVSTTVHLASRKQPRNDHQQQGSEELTEVVIPMDRQQNHHHHQIDEDQDKYKRRPFQGFFNFLGVGGTSTSSPSSSGSQMSGTRIYILAALLFTLGVVFILSYGIDENMRSQIEEELRGHFSRASNRKVRGSTVEHVSSGLESSLQKHLGEKFVPITSVTTTSTSKDVPPTVTFTNEEHKLSLVLNYADWLQSPLGNIQPVCPLSSKILTEEDEVIRFMNLQIFSMRAIDEYGKTFPSDTALAGFVIPGTNQPMVPPLDDNSSLAQQIKSKLSTFSWISHLLQSQKLLLQQEGQVSTTVHLASRKQPRNDHQQQGSEELTEVVIPMDRQQNHHHHQIDEDQDKYKRRPFQGFFNFLGVGGTSTSSPSSSGSQMSGTRIYILAALLFTLGVVFILSYGIDENMRSQIEEELRGHFSRASNRKVRGSTVEHVSSGLESSLQKHLGEKFVPITSVTTTSTSKDVPPTVT